MIQLSKNFLNAFQPELLGIKGVQDRVKLHSSCASIFVPSIVYAEAASLLKHEGTTTSSVIRTIMNSLIEQNIWAKDGMNYSKIKNQFPNECAACVGNYIIRNIRKFNLKFFQNLKAFVTSIRPLGKSQMTVFSETIGQMCVDARVKKSKKEKEKSINCKMTTNLSNIDSD